VKLALLLETRACVALTQGLEEFAILEIVIAIPES